MILDMHTNRRELWLRPVATGGQGYLDGAGHLGILNWLGLDWCVSLLGLETQAELDLHKRNGS